MLRYWTSSTPAPERPGAGVSGSPLRLTASLFGEPVDGMRGRILPTLKVLRRSQFSIIEVIVHTLFHQKETIMFKSFISRLTGSKGSVTVNRHEVHIPSGGEERAIRAAAAEARSTEEVPLRPTAGQERAVRANALKLGKE